MKVKIFAIVKHPALSKIKSELKLYVGKKKIALIDKQTTFQFWALNKKELPILSRIAKRVLSTLACSTDVERLFSTARTIVPALISNMNPKTTEMLTSMCVWLRFTHRVKDRRSNSSAESSSRFCTLSPK